MADKTIIVKKGGTVNITVNKRDNARALVPYTPKAIIRTRSPLDYLPRRKKNGIFINFYDIGQFTEDAGETWQEFDYTVVKDLILVSGYVEGTEPLTQSDWDAFRDVILATPRENFHSTFRKLDYERAERYGIDIYLKRMPFFSNNADKSLYFPVGRNDSRPLIRPNSDETAETMISETKWTPEGLKLSAPQTEQGFNLFTMFGFNPLLDTETTQFYKITSEADYDAPEAAFLIDKSTDFFLVPRIFIENAQAGYEESDSRSYWLNYYFVSLNRAFYIDGTGYAPETGEYDYSPFIQGYINRTVSPSYTTNEIIIEMKTRSEARMWKETTGYEIAFDFPNTPFYEDRPIGTNIAELTTDGDEYVRLAEGTLLAIAKKGDDWFYFWSTLERPSQFRRAGLSLDYPQAFRLEIDE